jgi:branched-chain amino acid transport system permease protein
MEKSVTAEASVEDTLRDILAKVNWSTWMAIGLSLVAMVVTGKVAGLSILVSAIVTGGMWALMAMGLALVFGVMNIPNFAHGEFFMIGTFIAYFIFTPLNSYLKENPSRFLSLIAPLLPILVAALVGLLLGVVVEKAVFYPLRRRTREQWIMNTFLLTVGLSFVFINGVLLLWGSSYRGIPRYWNLEPVRIGPVSIAADRLAVFLIAILIIAAFWFFLRRTRTGRAIRAVAQDGTGALMVGIDLNRIHTLTMALSSALAALAGASLLFMFQAYPTVGLKPLYFAWFVVILVGVGNVAGAIVALLQTLTSYFVGIAWEDVVPTAVMILILLFKPTGLFGSEVKGVWEQ